MLKNFTVLARAYWKAEPVWMAHRLLRHAAFFVLMALFEEEKTAKIRNIARGIMDGVRVKYE
jgi:hypothetical protein